MPFNDNLPAKGTDPWYAPLSTAWTNLKSFINGLETSLDTKASSDDLASGLSAKENVLTAGSNVTIDRTDPDAPVISAADGGGAVDSVNGKTGEVVLDAGDVSARPDTWVPAYSDVTGTPTLGTAAAADAADFATAAQGAKADSAVQPATLDTYVADETTINDPATETWATMDIVSDGSDSSNWPDRFKVTFTGSGGAATRPTFFLNEYGEIRGMPGLDNSVAARWFAALDDSAYAARSASTPIIEVVDKRSGVRTSLFAVYKGGALAVAQNPVGTVYTLEASEDETDIPAALPAGTLIVKKTA